MDPGQDWGEDAIPPPERPGVTGYFADTQGSGDKCKTLEAALQRLERVAGIETRVEYTRIDEQDWAEAWKEYFWPEKITDTIVVKPSWREYTAGPQEIVLEIDPGMAFGTGTHATTALCIRMIQTHLKPGDAFLDVGTGSGILMIAAAKLGAGTVCGVDNDEVAVTVAEKNLLANHIDRNQFTLSTGNLVDEVRQTFDVVAANILAEVILVLLPDVTAVLKENGRVDLFRHYHGQKRDRAFRLDGKGFCGGSGAGKRGLGGHCGPTNRRRITEDRKQTPAENHAEHSPSLNPLICIFFAKRSTTSRAL